MLYKKRVSTIIFLNRCGSSAKTSIAKAIQQEREDFWLTFGVDTFINMIPLGKQEYYLQFISEYNERGPIVHVKPGLESAKLFGIMPKLAEILTDHESNLSINEVLFDEDALKVYVQHLKNRPYCALQTGTGKCKAIWNYAQTC